MPQQPGMPQVVPGGWPAQPQAPQPPANPGDHSPACHHLPLAVGRASPESRSNPQNAAARRMARSAASSATADESLGATARHAANPAATGRGGWPGQPGMPQPPGVPQQGMPQAPSGWSGGLQPPPGGPWSGQPHPMPGRRATRRRHSPRRRSNHRRFHSHPFRDPRCPRPPPTRQPEPPRQRMPGVPPTPQGQRPAALPFHRLRALQSGPHRNRHRLRLRSRVRGLLHSRRHLVPPLGRKPLSQRPTVHHKPRPSALRRPLTGRRNHDVRRPPSPDPQPSNRRWPGRPQSVQRRRSASSQSGPATAEPRTQPRPAIAPKPLVRPNRVRPRVSSGGFPTSCFRTNRPPGFATRRGRRRRPHIPPVPGPPRGPGRRRQEAEGAWEYVIGSRAPGPVVLGPQDTLRLHCCDGYLHCLEAATGKQVWSPAAVGEPLGYAVPVTDRDGNTWVSLHDGGLA